MPKYITKQQKEAIQGYAKKGYSANQIQVKLRERNMGLRRKILLTEVRRIKGQKPKAETVKYIPKKYRKASWTIRAKGRPSRKRLKQFFAQFQEKQVAVYGYGKTDWERTPYSARFEFYGSGREILKAVQKVISECWVPYRKRAFVTVSAKAFLNNPYAFGKQGWWVWKPNVRS